MHALNEAGNIGAGPHLDASDGSAGFAVGHGRQLPVKAGNASNVPQEVQHMAGLQECCCRYVHIQGEAPLGRPETLAEAQPSLFSKCQRVRAGLLA